jgi:ABC-type multidrug transport system fused ATPase/permease subunit
MALLGYTFYTNWKLALLTFTIIPGLAFVFARTGRFLKHRITSHQEQNSLTHSTLQESVSGIRVIHQFNLQEKMFTIFKKQQSEVSRLLLKISKIEEASSPMVEFVISFAIALMLYFGGRAVLDHEMTSGELIAFFTAFAMMINPIRQFSDINGKLHAAAAAMDRIQNFLAWETRIKDVKQAAPFSRIKQGIRVKDISFHYPDTPERKVLDQVSFDIPIGKTIALVGHSGSGKSSIVQLMTRLFDVNQGGIFIDENDLRTIKIQDWRDHLAVVSQDVFLFHDTIYENIRIGHPHATRDEIIQAAKQAFAHDFIMSLPLGYDTVVGDRGAKLSGGERQRISIARAFLRQADLLILDEATSNLDNQSEKLVQETLDVLMKNKTTLVIAHRLSTIQNADEIIVLKEGKRVESGRYEDLIEKRGEFYQLAMNQ